ncbi:alpha/beta fold hydrolase [Rubrobacter tropicus]|uniref:Alpha/beta fold hydrolase n=1 Tax=Rubrobacter tropicus TaxID=2653851 RepID=A0A6G8QAX3_9ACTN|nr:alpha/beta fold hydrolase [Rubrobacter tropicus]QIN83611.1 alpha/beta fold hydrolase [Rubrobacter tropicus]
MASHGSTPFHPFRVGSYDNPETVRWRKYATGAHLVLRGAPVMVGRTPKEVVWAEGTARLYRYRPDSEKRHPVPILLVYALILKPYILDLIPGNSFVEYLVGEGFDVYMLDWGAPGSEDENLCFDTYILDYMPEVVARVLHLSRAEGLILFGYCQGGTMAVMYAAISAGESLRGLVLLAAPVDFAPDEPGLTGLWTLWSRNSGAFLGPVSRTLGNLPADRAGRFVERATAVAATVTRWPAVYAGLRAWAERDEAVGSFLAVGKWVDDGVAFPGAAFGRWIREFYQQDKLARGEIHLRGRRVDLSKIACPLLGIAGARDYICPVSQAEAVMRLTGSRDKEFLVLDAGHVGLMAGPVAKEVLWPRVRDWLEIHLG